MVNVLAFHKNVLKDLKWFIKMDNTNVYQILIQCPLVQKEQSWFVKMECANVCPCLNYKALRILKKYQKQNFRMSNLKILQDL